MKSSHFNNKGSARMVDISDKNSTSREAVAKASVKMKKETFNMILKGLHKKGDVLSIARIAGIMGAKRTSEIIPLCHPINIEAIELEFETNNKTYEIEIIACCKTNNKTGIEMEALTAVTIAALTIYDMCKSVDKGMIVGAIMLIYKSGGKSGTYKKNDNN